MFFSRGVSFILSLLLFSLIHFALGGTAVAQPRRKSPDVRLLRLELRGLPLLRKFISSNNPPEGTFGIEIVGRRPRLVLVDPGGPLPPITVQFIGTGELIDEDAGPLLDTPVNGGIDDPDEPPVDEVEIGRQGYRIFNTGTLLEFEVTVSEGLLDLNHRVREAQGLTGATEGVDDPDAVEGGILDRRSEGSHHPRVMLASAAPLGVTDFRRGNLLPPRLRLAARSNGIDTRVLLTITTIYPWRTISDFSQGMNCTGTLIGPRHLITAAHCIRDFGTNTWRNFTVTPARNGTATPPFGTSVIKPCPCQPGDPLRWYVTPVQWGRGETPQGKWDWGLIVIPDRLGNMTGWMGYAARPGRDLNPEKHWNRGYPSCSTTPTRPDIPSPCQANRLYGDLQPCVLGGYDSCDEPDGWCRTINHSCDTGSGQSGSPVYHYLFFPQSGKWWPVVSMVHSRSLCDKDVDRDGTVQTDERCMGDDDIPSLARRIAPPLFKVISFLRAKFP